LANFNRRLAFLAARDSRVAVVMVSSSFVNRHKRAAPQREAVVGGCSCIHFFDGVSISTIAPHRLPFTWPGHSPPALQRIFPAGISPPQQPHVRDSSRYSILIISPPRFSPPALVWRHSISPPNLLMPIYQRIYVSNSKRSTLAASEPLRLLTPLHRSAVSGARGRVTSRATT
jgi:hypothetical protein